MNIIEVIDIGFEAGGAEKSVKLLRDQLQTRGHTVQVISSDKLMDADTAGFADVLVPHIRGAAWRRLLGHAWHRPAHAAVATAVASMPADVVHLHTIGELSPSVLRACGDVPMIVTVHGPEEYTLELLPYQLPADDYRHRSYSWEDLRPVGRARYWYYRGVQRPNYRAGLRRVSTIVAPSAYMASVVAGDAGRVPVEHIYNGIVLPDPQPVPATPRIVYVGRLEAVKGVEHLIDAAARARTLAPGLEVILIGDGADRPRLETQAAALGLADTVRFVGWVAPDDVATEMARARALAIPSVWPENLPTVAIEAMAVGRAIIGTNVGGIPELIEPGVTGFIVEPRDPDALAEAMVALCGSDARAARMGAAARIRGERFDIDTFVDRIEALYGAVQPAATGADPDAHAGASVPLAAGRPG